jgi:hypothetical protein
MGLGEFVVPSVDEWIDALGVEPWPQEGDEDVSRVVFTSDSGDTMDVSFAPGGNSVQFRWLRGDALLLDITREGARHMWVESGQGQARIGIEFEVEGLRGGLTVRLLPEFRVKDTRLFA